MARVWVYGIRQFKRAFRNTGYGAVSAENASCTRHTIEIVFLLDI
jgi:hypothetical protein